jgi:thiol-disulfide isomerase/thioredoxin
MRNIYLISLFFLLAPRLLPAQTFKVFDNFSELEERILQAPNSTTLVINFWATWCAPCVEELPHFDALHQKYANSNFEVLLVSLDMKSRLEKTLVPFLEKHKLKPEIILLADQYADGWIPQIHESWEGPIPVTLLVRGEQREFFPEQFENFSQLEAFVLNFIKKSSKPLEVDTKNDGTR